MLTQKVSVSVGSEVLIDGKRFINFAGSSYLGLPGRPEVIHAGEIALQKYGMGYQLPASAGYKTEPNAEAELAAARFFGSESAFLLASGYHFAFVILAMLRNKVDALFIDSGAHYSLLEAARSSGIKSYFYDHLDVENLRAKLETNLPHGLRPAVLTDAVYSTWGEMAPLDRIVALVEPFGGSVVVDESHAFGILGSAGRGATHHFGLTAKNVLYGGSTCKALGIAGGVVPCTLATAKELLKTPVAIGASGLNAVSAAMLVQTFAILETDVSLLSQLASNVQYAKSGMKGLGINVTNGVIPIVSFRLASAKAMKQLQIDLKARGILVSYSTYLDTTADGVVRCAIFSDHTKRHIDALIEALQSLLCMEIIVAY